MKKKILEVEFSNDIWKVQVLGEKGGKKYLKITFSEGQYYIGEMINWKAYDKDNKLINKQKSEIAN